jgi:hypothetical protein
MEASDAFEKFLQSALETFGIEADETERAVMAGVWSLYRPNMELLSEADLDDVELELHVDLSKPPAP